jgi:cytochrome c oxidase cbb3-type subunit III
MNGRCGYLIVVLIVAAGCDLPGKPRSGDRPVPPDQVLNFATLYGQNCAGCHGADGKLGPAPPLNNKLFLNIVPDSVLQSVIAEGRPGTPMPAFAESRGGTLTAAQVKALAEGIKPRWRASGESGSAEPPPYAAKGDKQGTAERGAGVFARACAGCHGAEGEGDKAGAINDRSFLAVISDQALRRYAITGRPDLGMPDFATTDRNGREDSFQPLSATEIDDLVALLAHWRQAGSADKP